VASDQAVLRGKIKDFFFLFVLNIRYLYFPQF